MAEMNRIPQDADRPIVACEYRVGSWSDQPAAVDAPPDAVMFELRPTGTKHSLGVRFKTPEAVDELIDALTAHRNTVWPSRER